jgi:hypothetical protein
MTAKKPNRKPCTIGGGLKASGRRIARRGKEGAIRRDARAALVGDLRGGSRFSLARTSLTPAGCRLAFLAISKKRSC